MLRRLNLSIRPKQDMSSRANSAQLLEQIDMLEVTWGGLKQSLKRSQKLTLRMDELSDMVQSSGDVMEDSEMRKHPWVF